MDQWESSKDCSVCCEEAHVWSIASLVVLNTTELKHHWIWALNHLVSQILLWPLQHCLGILPQLPIKENSTQFHNFIRVLAFLMSKLWWVNFDLCLVCPWVTQWLLTVNLMMPSYWYLWIQFQVFTSWKMYSKRWFSPSFYEDVTLD